MLKRNRIGIILLICLLNSCKYHTEREVLNKWIPENLFFFMLIGGSEDERMCGGKYIKISDSAWVFKTFSQDIYGNKIKCDGSKIKKKLYQFNYSSAKTINGFLKENDFKTIHLRIDTTRIHRKKYDKNLKRYSDSDTFIELRLDTFLVFYNCNNQTFYELYAHKNEIYCWELDEDEIFLQTKCE